jgi:2-methylisocitrate lyase-like PEP mutase family enzyme
VDWVRPPDRLGELLAQSDYVVIAAPHTPATAGMISLRGNKALRRLSQVSGEKGTEQEKGQQDGRTTIYR